MDKSLYAMEIDLKKFRRSLQRILRSPDDELNECLRLWPQITPASIEKCINLLSVRILDAEYTITIRDNFPDLLLLIVTKAFPIEPTPTNHVVKCIALSKLIASSQHVRKFAQQYFSTAPSPFSVEPKAPRPKRAKPNLPNIGDVQIVKCCLSFLQSDTNFYKTKWSWSDFVVRFSSNRVASDEDSATIRLYSNSILATLASMSTQQLHRLNKRDLGSYAAVTVQALMHDESAKLSTDSVLDDRDDADCDEEPLRLTWPFHSDIVTCVQGVLLPIFNIDNYRYYQRNAGTAGIRMVMVESTRANLCNLALGIASDKALCLSGPVGCGKTSLVEYVAQLTGRVEIPWHVRWNEADEANNLTQNGAKRKSGKGKKRKTTSATKPKTGNAETQLQASASGFLRLQLGDQTDSKMLLGQYRCTDVPGEFVWQAGALTQAIVHGYWLLLEDIDLATQDVTVALTNLLENNYLSVPGLNDCLRIAPGFQLFVTIRNQKQSNCTQQSNMQMLNKYMYVVNMQPSRPDELRDMVDVLYPRFQSIDGGIVDRMVRVFLKFSCGDHNNGELDSNSVDVAESAATTSRQAHSNRLVSSRDLIKWCTRSHSHFADTSEATRFLVLKNAVDLFGGYLPDVEKRKMIALIGAELNISIGMCDKFASEHSPNVQLTSEEIIVGRVQLQKHLSTTVKEFDDSDRADDGDNAVAAMASKKQKTDVSAYRNVFQECKQKAPTFSFTRIARCIMERIAVAVQQNEPVLLVGETGVGKTSSVQYLAHHTCHKLVVVNMNNQSDVSDLIGGFKPVDFAFVLAPLRTEFEALFKLTFNASKNEKFLNHLSVCFTRSEFVVLIKLMLRIIQTVVSRGTGKPTVMAVLDDATLARWQVLNVKLLKLEAQLKKSLNISFAFVPGSLVNCIQNGDWVLLDEINLATAETLECLSTILEPDGSIVLLEKGDLVPVRRHPEFRIFACMNPSTDVGKKELPVGIRNRFTEFYADELEQLSDLEILIRDYLINTGIPAAKLSGIARMYERLRRLARLDLNDGLGNRPVYSLRTLCRALAVCARNLCGSIDRNLYESFCLAFLTQLDPASHTIVLQLIQTTILGKNVMAVLKQQIPRPVRGNYIYVEGYWIETGTHTPEECRDYILTPSVRQNLKDLARIIAIGRLPVLLQGPTSAGKTSLIQYVARLSGNCCLRINNHEHTDLQEYIGTYTADASGRLSFREGVLVEAMRQGHWIILDELNLASSDILEALNRVLDDNRELFIAETQTLVRAHPNFMLFATQNPPGLYGGRKTLSRAFKNRFIELHFADIPRIELEEILEKRSRIPKSYAQKMVKTMAKLHIRQTHVRNAFTLRDLFRWGNRYTFADDALLADNRYDWNQHLVDEGYLVLSAKIRTDADVAAIEDALFANFRKRIDLSALFELSATGTSMVTKSILERISAHPKFGNIVWTFNMRRMAVLTAKALQFNEPVLLVGPTGCGKTTVCQILADIAASQLRILNCHMHTEGADFLGGLRPYRGTSDCDETAMDSSNNDGDNQKAETQRKLFEWANGPLVLSMQEGSYFLADEISLAEDSVLERLNCILEPERTVLLSEKGGGADVEMSDLIVVAAAGFQFMATMNPGGDFGKKELSPALRNRFTEIWCRATDTKDDLCHIAGHQLKTNFEVVHDASAATMTADIAEIIVDSVFYMKQMNNKFNFSIRDVLAWIAYVTKHARLTSRGTLTLPEALVFGMETMFLDALEMLPHDSIDEVELHRKQALRYLLEQLRRKHLNTDDLAAIQKRKGDTVELNVERFGIRPFYLDRAIGSPIDDTGSFVFTAPTTQRNLFCLLSALSLHKPILLEGPPGVGKTSLVEQVTAAIGYNIVRINLCEHTDLADLFGADLPATDDDNDVQMPRIDDADNSGVLGSFVWRDGPLLAALKRPNTWILLDELNLAPQSVLEGLNAVLDHRGEVYIPELNKTFKLGSATRIFAAQNPLKQGGGRKGLPQSFLNRFTKVYLRKLQRDDLHHVVRAKYQNFFTTCAEYVALVSADAEQPFDLCDAIVGFTESLDAGISNFEFGFKGGPFEVNLRDILRWCEFLSNETTGLLLSAKDLPFSEFMRVVYEKMKVVYWQRMRTPADKAFIANAFQRHFGSRCDAAALERESRDISLYWSDGALFLDDVRCSLAGLQDVKTRSNAAAVPLLLRSQRDILKNMVECMIMQKPVIMCGPTDCGKTKAIDVMCTLINRASVVDTIDDSVTGSFQQIDLNRHLEEVASHIEELLIALLQHYILQTNDSKAAKVVELLASWESYVEIARNPLEETPSTQSAISADLVFFKSRLQRLTRCFDAIENSGPTVDKDRRSAIRTQLKRLDAAVENSTTLNSGGHFEWVDSKIVTAFKTGHIICLEHVNLCSSAIVDRLNPMFEVDGSLLLSEKGITASEEPEIVRRHKHFNAFLTLDPKNGEISRAMRNRCIELHISREEYDADDLKSLIYRAGVHEMHVIGAVLAIHQRCRAVSDFSVLGVAQIIKFADLVVRYRQLGSSAAEALQSGAVEVYVRSAQIDLTGYGLGFYRNQLQAAIEEVTTQLSPTVDLFDYGNVLCEADNMNALALVRLKCEILLSVMRGLLTERIDDLNVELTGLFSAFDMVDITFDELLCKTLLTVIYESASAADLEHRRLYLRFAFEQMRTQHSTGGIIDTMLQLNEDLYATVRLGIAKCATVDDELPWNRQMFPRLWRHYAGDNIAGNDWPLSTQRRLSALLSIQTFLRDLQIGSPNTKLSQMTALTFSAAVQTRRVQNVPNNELVQHLHAYLTQMRPHLIARLQNVDWAMTTDELVSVVCASLWHNRLHECAQRQLFVGQRIDDALINLIAIHVKWTEKYLITKLPALKSLGTDAFEKTRAIVSNIVKSKQHPLHRLRKRFGKHLTNFQPYYDAGRIDAHNKTTIVLRETSLTRAFGAALEPAVISRRLATAQNSRIVALKVHLASLQSNWLTNTFLGADLQKHDVDLTKGELSQSVAQFVVRSATNTHQEEDSAFDLEESFAYLLNQLHQTEHLADRFVAEMLPIREYYALRSLNRSLMKKSKPNDLNHKFFEVTASIGVSELHLVHTLNGYTFANCEDLWTNIWQTVSSSQLPLTDLVAQLPSDFYRNYSTCRRNLTAAQQAYAMRSLATKRSTAGGPIDAVADFLWGGPIFTSAALTALFDPFGSSKTCGLAEIESWQSTLQQFMQMLWNNALLFQRNFNFELANLRMSFSRSQQLLVELDAVFAASDDKTNIADGQQSFIADFVKLRDVLSGLHESCKALIDTDTDFNGSTEQRSSFVCLSSSICTIVGAIEINLLTHLPLLDPAEKNRLKDKYTTEDRTHVQQLLAAFECMQITMKYRDLGRDCVEPYTNKLQTLQKHSQLVPLRPIACNYTMLLKDVTHFLQTCCQPAALLELFAAVQSNLNHNGSGIETGSSNIAETIKRIELWISNAAQFVHHTLAKYAPYYMDFVVPIRNSIVMMESGLRGLKHCLQQQQMYTGTGATENGASTALNALLGNLVAFPSVGGLCILPGQSAIGGSVSRVLIKSERYDAHYLKLLKVKLREIENSITLTTTISEANVHDLQSVLSLFNGVWQKQEEIRRKRKTEDESLYATKTRCAEDDDDEVAAREVQSMFPNTIDDDFGDLIDAVTLEHKPERTITTRKSAGTVDLLQSQDISHICVTFANVMRRFSRSYYYRASTEKDSDDSVVTRHDYVRDYKDKFQVFVELFPKYQQGLDGFIDDAVYGGVSLLVGSGMQDMNLLKLNDCTETAYNFYKDANITEVITCTVPLNKIETRVKVQLDLYPEHAGLLDILSIIKRIRSFPTTSPVMRFSSGFQILNKKLNEWNKLAHRGNTMIDLEVEVGGYIQRWMKLELQCWRECLSQSYEKIQAKAHRYWFFIFNLVNEYMSSDQTWQNVLKCDLTDFKAVEKNFDDDDDTTTTDPIKPIVPNTRLRSRDVINVLRQFIESANYADFTVRMRILKSFEQYLYMLKGEENNNRRANTLITILHNVHLYFVQFGGELDTKLKAMRLTVEKKLKEFVKMESYSKYLSYFSQDASIAQVHRKLHKFLKEFEQQIGEKISAVFILRDTQISDTTNCATPEPARNGNTKSPQPAATPQHIVDVQHFICGPTTPQYYAALHAMNIITPDSTSLQLLPKSEKLYSTARTICKHAILHSQYPGLVYNLQTLLDDHLESVQHLRGLEVDRSQEKPRQKVQAKQILQQKRKALTDFYKVLARLGLSYRAGLMEIGLVAGGAELTDLKIAPFCVRTMIAANVGNATVRPALLALSDKLDWYFARSMYKLKLLQTVLLQPHADIGIQHLERIKGFAVDMFLLVQAQRKSLSAFVLNLADLRKHVRNVADLQASFEAAATKTTTFAHLSRKYAQMQSDLGDVCDVIGQYQILYKCAPSCQTADSSANTVLTSCCGDAADRTTEKHSAIRRLCEDITIKAQTLLGQLGQQDDHMFYTTAICCSNDAQFVAIRADINALAELFLLDASTEKESHIHGKALLALQSQMDASDAALAEQALSAEIHTPDEFANTDVEIENILHSMLLSMQSIYKKHSDHKLETGITIETTTTTAASQTTSASTDSAHQDHDDDDPIELNHLKIRVTQQMHSDLDILHVQKIASKLHNILLTIRHSTDGRMRETAAQKIAAVLPILEQYQQLCLFYLVQQLGAQQVSGRMLVIVLTVFVELGAKGFCVPPDLMGDEDGDAGENKEEKGSEGFGLEDGTGEKDVSDKLESEDQLDSAKKPGDDKETDDKEDADCKEEKGIDMSEDFDSKLQDLEKKEPNSDSDNSDDDDEEADKQMGETEDGAEKLDDQIWGSDEEKDEEENEGDEMNDEEDGKGSKDEDEKHNDLANKNNETAQGNEDDEDRDGLDAADNEQQEKKQKDKDIDTMDEPDVGEDQINPYHNELEEPPEPEDVDLGDNFNLDKEENGNEEDRPEENPFDIDTMKEQMDVDIEDGEKSEDGEDKDADATEKAEDDDSDSDDDENTGDTKRDQEQPEDDVNEEQPPAEEDETPAESSCPMPKEDDEQLEPDAEAEPEPEKTGDETKPIDEDHHQSKDKASKEENIQSMPDDEQKQSSRDKVQNDSSTTDEPQKPDEMDDQDTGEDNQAIGQAENDESKSGHQGVADTRELQSSDRKQPQQEQNAQDKRKQGKTDEERTLGDPEQSQKRQLKTIDKVNRNETDKEKEEQSNEPEPEADAEEYQHVREAKTTDQTTMDNATEEQSKLTAHENDADDKPTEDDEEATTDLADDVQPEEEPTTPVEELSSEQTDMNSDKPSKKRERQQQERTEEAQPIEVEGEYVDTHSVQRGAESTAHCAMDMLQDKEMAVEPTALETLELRQMFEKERTSTKLVHTSTADFEAWQTISSKMLPNARELCEQLRLILEPTKCTRLKGDYRTGRRINLKKIIPYIASQFRKDKIWLRRTKPAQRDYKITVAIDDSKSMAHNNSKVLTLEAISLLSQALTLLESGRLSIVSFGEQPQIVLNHSEQFDGPKLCGSLRFDQNQSRIAEMLHFARVAGAEEAGGSSDNGIFENLLLILSDGRNIFSEGERVVRNAVKLARLQRIFIVYIIIDNPENKNSILDIQAPKFGPDGRMLPLQSYMDSFPFPYYVIVRDLAQLPLVLSDAMRQWFELVNSEE